MKLFIPGAGGKVLHIKNFQEIPAVSKVIISDTDPWAYGNFVADASYIVPPFKSPQFMDALERIYEIEKFDVLIPIHDVSLFLFSAHRQEYASFPFTLAINPKETIDIVSDKLLTYRFFLKHQIPTAEIFTIEEFLQLNRYASSYFIKPRYIHMREGPNQFYMKIEDEADIEFILRKVKGREAEYVIQEFISGEEINVDFFCDNEGIVRSIVPLKRLGMGVSRGITRGEIVFEKMFDSYVHKTAGHLRLWGANNMQVYVTPEGNLKFTEINGRFSGSSVLVKEAGVNYFQYFIKLLNGKKIEIQEKPRHLKMCSWEKPYFFLDENARYVTR